MNAVLDINTAYAGLEISTAYKCRAWYYSACTGLEINTAYTGLDITAGGEDSRESWTVPSKYI